MRFKAAALLAALCGCAPAVTPRAGVPIPPPAPAASGNPEQVVFQRVNEARVHAGCPALVWSPTAAGVAEAHSADMARRRYFSHVSPEGVQPAQRLSAAGIDWSRIAENIAQTSGGPEDAVRLWLGSAGHRANILNCGYTHTGIGQASDRWTQVFYTPAAR